MQRKAFAEPLPLSAFPKQCSKAHRQLCPKSASCGSKLYMNMIQRPKRGGNLSLKATCG